MNQVTLYGCAAGEPMKMQAGATTKCRFKLACKREYKNAAGEYETDFITIEAWSQLSEFLVQKLQKSDFCIIQGRIRSNSYQVQNETKYETIIVADRVVITTKRGQ